MVSTTEGMVFGWGRNDFGQIGIGNREQEVISKPQQIHSLKEKKIVMTAAGETHTLFLTEFGEVYSCGFNEYGELGLGQLTSILMEDGRQSEVDTKGNPQEHSQERMTELQQIILNTKIEVLPKQVFGLELIVFIAVGKNHSIAIKNQKKEGE